MPGRLLVISGPSGAGKSTVLKLFKDRHSDWIHPPSMTTRPKRTGEKEGKDYFFVSRSQFEKAQASGELLEHFTVTGNLYGTPRKPIEEALQSGHDVVVVKEVNGALALKKAFPDAVLVAIVLEDWSDLMNRLSQRDKTDKKFIEKRLRLAEEEIKELAKFHRVQNPTSHPEKALKTIEKLLKL